MEKLKLSQINSLFTCAENVNNIFDAAYKIAISSNYPDLQGLTDAAQEFNRNLFLIANFLYNPDAEQFVDAVIEKEKQLSL